MSEQIEDDGPTKDVTVKKMSRTAWALASKRSGARHESMAIWLARAIETQAAIEERDGILPPDAAAPPWVRAALARGDAVPAPAAPIDVVVLDVDAAAKVARMMHDTISAAVAAGAKPSKSVVSEGRRIVDRTLRVLNGKTPDRPRRVPPPPRQKALPAPAPVANDA